MQASFETTILSGAPLSLFLCLPLSLSLCLVELFFGESASTKSQTSILDQGPRQPAATQLHQLVGAASPWSGRREGRMEKTGTGTAHRLQHAHGVQRASRMRLAVHSQPQVA